MSYNLTGRGGWRVPTILQVDQRTVCSGVVLCGGRLLSFVAKSSQTVREIPVPDVIFWIPPNDFLLLLYESLPGAIQLAAAQMMSYAASGHMEALSSVYALFNLCLIDIPRIW